MLIDAANLNHFWAQLIVEELVRCGVETFFLAPGSRSTPLTVAVARHSEAHPVMHYDERGTAFGALGYARATTRPAAWITTSGTAVANGLPAAVEAANDNVPLLLLTADRPPELRDTAANQTIDQVNIFGNYVRWQFDLPTPTPQIDPTTVLTTVDQAAYRARRPPAGPVHLNCMFRKPLHPVPDRYDIEELASSVSDWQEHSVPYTHYEETRSSASQVEIETLWQDLRSVQQGLLVTGRLTTRTQAEAVEELAAVLDWPCLPDVGSHLRLGIANSDASLVGYYDQLLASEAFAAHAPEAVLHVGGRLTSKRLRHFLKQHRPNPYLLVHDTPARIDPGHQVTRRLESNPALFCRTLTRTIQDDSSSTANTSWHQRWRAASEQADRQIKAMLADDDMLSEPLVARHVTRHLPEGHGLVVASSMPVRDVNRYAAIDGPAARIATNRGASGIDGTVATAAGFAQGLDAPVTLLIGDLALLHDLNSLLLPQRIDPPLTVVVLNNRGGGIFSFLPIAEHEDVYEPFFGTPHHQSFEEAAAMFELDYRFPETPNDFERIYREAAQSSASTLIEVRTDREENRVLHERLETAVSQAVTS